MAEQSQPAAPAWIAGVIAPAEEAPPPDTSAPADATDLGDAAPAAEPSEPGQGEPGEAAGVSSADDGEPAAPAQMVPHAALHEERRRRQEIEQRLAERDRTVQSMEQTFARFVALQGQQGQAQRAKPEAPEAPPPSFADDPTGAFNAAVARIEQLQQQLAGVQQQGRQRTAAEQQAQQFQQLQGVVAADERRLAAEGVADYQQAVMHAVGVRQRQLAMTGLPEPDIQRTIGQEIGWIAENAVRNGRRPAEVIYGMAKEMGYQPVGRAGAPSAAASAVSQAQRMAAAAPASGGAEANAGQMTLRQLAEVTDPARFKAEFDRMLQPSRLRRGFALR